MAIVPAGKYYDAVNRGNVYTAYATLTAPVIYTTAAATGGPLLWNRSSSVNVSLLAVGFASSVVTTVATGLGITGGIGQYDAPASPTALDGAITNLYVGGPASKILGYRLGTPTNAGTFFIPLMEVHTGALTVDTGGMRWVDVGGLVIAPPMTWISIAGGATASTLQVQVALIWEEVKL